MLWVVLTILIVFIITILKILQPLKYWKEKNIPHEAPWPLVGNTASFIFRQNSYAELLQNSYNKFYNHRYYGFYQFMAPTLIVKDPDLIKQIFIKEFDVFTDHMEMLPKSSDPFWNKNLFSMTGKEWHDMRCTLSPLFSSGKLKMMFSFIIECAQRYLDYFRSLSNGEVATIEMKSNFLRFTNDTIASTAFGIEINSIKDKDNEFYRLGRNAFNFEGIRSLKFFGMSISPTLMKLLGVQLFDDNFKNFFLNLVNDTIKFREETGCIRLDMIHFLREAQKGRSIEDNDEEILDEGYAITSELIQASKSDKKMKITNEDIAAQAAVFFFGGFETAGDLMCFMAYELALNPDVQATLIQEVDETLTKCDGKLNYRAMAEMRYLDMVASETLRKWPAAIFLTRKCSKPFVIQPENSSEEPFTLEKDLTVQVPVYAIHRDSKYYPDPEKFDPARFSAENKHKIRTGTFLPFGIGPRSCIASRFAIIEAKVIIFYLLTEFEIVPVEKTQIPFTLTKKNVNLTNDDGYWLGLKPRRSGACAVCNKQVESSENACN